MVDSTHWTVGESRDLQVLFGRLSSSCPIWYWPLFGSIPPFVTLTFAPYIRIGAACGIVSSDCSPGISSRRRGNIQCWPMRISFSRSTCWYWPLFGSIPPFVTLTFAPYIRIGAACGIVSSDCSPGISSRRRGNIQCWPMRISFSRSTSLMTSSWWNCTCVSLSAAQHLWWHLLKHLWWNCTFGEPKKQPEHGCLQMTSFFRSLLTVWT